MEEVSEKALAALRSALDDVHDMSRNGNSQDEYEALLYLVKKSEALLSEVGYG